MALICGVFFTAKTQRPQSDIEAILQIGCLGWVGPNQPTVASENKIAREKSVVEFKVGRLVAPLVLWTNLYGRANLNIWVKTLQAHDQRQIAAVPGQEQRLGIEPEAEEGEKFSEGPGTQIIDEPDVLEIMDRLGVTPL